MARPKIEIDKEQFQKLCALQCTLKEIASWFKCSEDTIENWCKRTYVDEAGKPMGFSDTYKIYATDGKISLRRFQFKQAEKSTAMAIWLGKQWLGQKDHIDVGLDATDKNEEVKSLEEYFKRRKQEGIS